MIHTPVTKRNNYLDGQFVDIEDFQAEQDYFLDRVRYTSTHLGTGISVSSDLTVVADSVMAEPVSEASVAIAIPASPDITASNPQNFTSFPGSLNGTSIRLYTVFPTVTTNIQRIDLRVTLAQARTTEQLDLIVSILQLVDPTNPLSPLFNGAPIAQVQLTQSDIGCNMISCQMVSPQLTKLLPSARRQ